MLIDFSSLPPRNKTYGGANGTKRAVLYNNEIWMIKFPTTAKVNKNMHYTNGCVSEYIGSHIFNELGIPAQETLLGEYKDNGKTYLVVACKDFVPPGYELKDFASLKNQIINSSGGGYGTELEAITETIMQQKVMPAEILEQRFWDMFVVDAFIGNWDRHNGNWGFLYNPIEDTMSLSPVYDCGSCLFPQADSDIIQNILNDKNELDFRVYQIPTSAIRSENNRINYFDFISSLSHNECNDALSRIVPRIDMKNIEEIIDSTPAITREQKTFYKTMLAERKARILDYAYAKLINLSNNLVAVHTSPRRI